VRTCAPCHLGLLLQQSLVLGEEPLDARAGLAVGPDCQFGEAMVQAGLLIGCLLLPHLEPRARLGVLGDTGHSGERLDEVLLRAEGGVELMRSQVLG